MVVRNIFTVSSKTAKKTCHNHSIWGSNKDPGLCTATVWHLLYSLSTNSIIILFLLVKKLQDSAIAIISLYIRNQFFHSSWSPEFALHIKSTRNSLKLFKLWSCNIYLLVFTSLLFGYLLSFKTLDYRSPGPTFFFFSMREDTQHQN